MNDKPLLIMSVYSRHSLKWFNIQKKAIEKTTTNYIHAVYLNNIDITETNGSIVVGKSVYNTDKKQSHQHYNGLNQLLDYAKLGDYRGWLFLDCDCFPINNRWEQILNNKNAAVIRTENLDTFFHPCAVYSADKNLSFRMLSNINLLGQHFSEVTAIGNFFPMVRTNKLNLDPLKYAVYYDLFYHHCAGSRKFLTRTSKYYKSYNKNYNHYEKLFFEDPFGFINKLAGEIHGNTSL